MKHQNASTTKPKMNMIQNNHAISLIWKFSQWCQEMLFQWCWRSPSKHHHFGRLPCLPTIQLMGISRYNDCIDICFTKIDVTKWVFFKTIRSHKWCSRKSSRSYFFTRKISTGSARYCSCGIWWLCRNPVVRNQPKCCSDSNHFSWMVLPPDQILPYNDSIGTSTCHYHL